MYCKNCGRSLREDDWFCPHCGSQIEKARPKSGGKSFILIAALVLMLTGVMCLFLFQWERFVLRKEIATIEALVQFAVAPYEDDTGTVPEANAEAAMQAVYQGALAAVSSGHAAFAEQNAGSVVIGLPNGGAYAYLPPEPAGEEPTSDEPVPAASTPGTGGRIVTIQPFYSETETWRRDMPDQTAQGIVEVLTDYTFDHEGGANDDNRDDQEVTIEFLKTLSNYSVVIWQGHGGYSERYGSFLVTTIPYAGKYGADIRAGRMLVCQSGGLCICPEFVDAYVEENDYPETLVYLGTCNSGKDNRLADSFLKKGFDCVIANSDVITRTYNLAVQQQFFGGMSAESGDFLTSGEALDYARAVCGPVDPYLSLGTRPLLFGSEDVCFARVSAVAPALTPEPVSIPEPEETPIPELTPAPAVSYDAGTDDPDYRVDRYVPEIIDAYSYGETPWEPPMDLSEMVACEIQDCFMQDGRYYITVDYAYWQWSDDDAPYLFYANTSSRTYTLEVSDDALISVFFRGDSLDEIDYGETDETTAFYAPADWSTLESCYLPVSYDSGSGIVSTPLYYFLHFAQDGTVDCIWQDIYLFYNN